MADAGTEVVHVTPEELQALMQGRVTRAFWLLRGLTVLIVAGVLGPTVLLAMGGAFEPGGLREFTNDPDRMVALVLVATGAVIAAVGLAWLFPEITVRAPAFPTTNHAVLAEADFPELHAIVRDAAKRLGHANAPKVAVGLLGTIEAVSARRGLWDPLPETYIVLSPAELMLLEPEELRARCIEHMAGLAVRGNPAGIAIHRAVILAHLFRHGAEHFDLSPAIRRRMERWANGAEELRFAVAYATHLRTLESSEELGVCEAMTGSCLKVATITEEFREEAKRCLVREAARGTPLGPEQALAAFVAARASITESDVERKLRRELRAVNPRGAGLRGALPRDLMLAGHRDTVARLRIEGTDCYASDLEIERAAEALCEGLRTRRAFWDTLPEARARAVFAAIFASNSTLSGEAGVRFAEHHSEVARKVRELDVLAHVRPLTADELLQLADLCRVHDPARDQEALLRAALAADPDHPGALAALAEHLLRVRGSDEGIDLYHRLFRLNYASIVEGSRSIADYLSSAGREVEAKEYLDLGSAVEQRLQKAREALAVPAREARLEAHRVPQDRVEALVADLRQVLEIRRVYIFRRPLEQFLNLDVHVVGVMLEITDAFAPPPYGPAPGGLATLVQERIGTSEVLIVHHVHDGWLDKAVAEHPECLVYMKW